MCAKVALLRLPKQQHTEAEHVETELLCNAAVRIGLNTVVKSLEKLEEVLSLTHESAASDLTQQM